MRDRNRMNKTLRKFWHAHHGEPVGWYQLPPMARALVAAHRLIVQKGNPHAHQTTAHRPT